MNAECNLWEISSDYDGVFRIFDSSLNYICGCREERIAQLIVDEHNWNSAERNRHVTEELIYPEKYCVGCWRVIFAYGYWIEDMDGADICKATSSKNGMAIVAANNCAVWEKIESNHIALIIGDKDSGGFYPLQPGVKEKCVQANANKIYWRERMDELVGAEK